MKKMKALAVAIVLVVAFSSVGAFAEDTKVSGYASADIMSNYVWRGQKLSNSWVVQPSVGIGYGSFSTNLWANWDSDWEDENELTETDLTLDYGFTFDKLALNVGYIYYGFESASDTQELYVALAYDVLLSPSLTVYYDYDEGQGAFAILAIGHSFKIGEMDLNLGASASCNFENKIMGTDADGDEFTGLYNGEISASLAVPITSALSLEPKIAFSFALSDDAEDAIKSLSNDEDSSVVYGGLGVSLSF